MALDLTVAAVDFTAFDLTVTTGMSASNPPQEGDSTTQDGRDTAYYADKAARGLIMSVVRSHGGRWMHIYATPHVIPAHLP
jgi:hypothetical protein